MIGFCLSIPRFMDIWFISTFWLSWMLLWISICKFFCEQMFSILLGINPGVEMLGHMLTFWLTFKELPKCFPKWLYHLNSQQSTKVPISPLPRQHLLSIAMKTKHTNWYINTFSYHTSDINVLCILIITNTDK